MSETKRPLKVFLCHASADKLAVRNLYQRLVADGVDAWLDAESLIAGQNWQVEIPKAIRNSDVVIVCLSERSINKEGYVQREIKFALDIADEKPEGTIFIIPARLEECKVPDRLSMYHWVELFEKDGYERLVRALRLRADKIGATLQVKKNWLPITIIQPERSKKPSAPAKKLIDVIQENHKAKKNKEIRKAVSKIFIAAIGLVVLVVAFMLSLPFLFSETQSTPTPMISTLTPMILTATSTTTSYCIMGAPDWVRNYVIQPGDTIYSIASDYGASTELLKRVNCRASDLVFVGDVLWVPLGVTRTPSVFTPYPTNPLTETALPFTLTPKR